MTFVPENPLEEAMLLANKSAMKRREFQKLLLESDLIVIGHVEGRAISPEMVSIEPGEKLQIVSTKYNGRSCIPVFSSMTRLNAFLKKDASYLRLNARTLLEVTRGATLLLNPGSEVGKEFPPEEIESLIAPKTIH